MEIGTIKKLSTQLGCPDVYEKLNSRMKMLEGSSTRISITGGHSGGKSSLINALLGTHEEVSLLPTYKTTRFVRKGLSVTVDAGTIPVTEVDSAWMQAQKLEVWELSDLDVEGEMTLIQLGEHYAHTDVCVMLLNAMMPLSRTEMTKIEALEKLGIPTLLVFSMADRMQENDYQEVAKYVKQKTSSFHVVKVLAPEKPTSVAQQAEEVRRIIDELLNEVGGQLTLRPSLKRLFLMDALSTLFEACNQKLGDTTAQEDVERMTAEKQAKLSDMTTVWLRLQAALNQRKNETAEKIRTLLEKKKAETVRQLKHNVEMCQDVKLYWEKELPYRLEDVVRMYSQTASQQINADVLNTINWLNGEIKKSFNKSLNSLQPISCEIEPEAVPTTTDVEIADTKKMRIVARIGTAVTVIAAGTMCATMGVGGIVMATGMMAGIGAEFLMNRKQNESKERVQELIPQMVTQAQQKLVITVSDHLNSAYNDLIKNLQSYQDQWIEEAKQSIEKEKQIALYNHQVEQKKWDECMQEINSLSAEIMDN